MGADSPSGVVASGAVAITSNPRAVRVVTEVAAVEKAFDYAVTEATEMVGIGDRVRINFHNRRIKKYRNGSGGKGQGFFWTIWSPVRSVSKPSRRSNITFAPNRVDATPRPV